MLKLIKKASYNKVVWYVLTRYATYGIQFVVSLLCAAKMGPYYFGLWGFILLLLNYIQQFNLGISNSANIMLVQERDNLNRFAQIESTAFVSQGFLCVGVMIFALGNYFFGYGFLEKYKIGNLFYLTCVTAMMAYMVQICMTIYRIKHQLSEIAIAQSSVPFFTLAALFLATGKELLLWFSLAYLIGNSFSFLLFMVRGKISLKYRPDFGIFSKLLRKGMYLFIYNSCFYLIIISTRTVVSTFYQVEEFGYFTFAYTLADAVILLLAAVSFLLFPKSIEKLHTSDVSQVKRVINKLRGIFMTLTHGLMYMAFLAFPVITWFIPKYNLSLPAIYMVALALLTNTISCGYPDYLMAQNKDRQIAFVSALALCVNIMVAVFLAIVIRCSYEYVVIATILSYWLFSVLCVYLGSRLMGEKSNIPQLVKYSFPLRLLIPFLLSFPIVFLDCLWAVPIPFLTFIILNLSYLNKIKQTFCQLIYNPNMLEIVRK